MHERISGPTGTEVFLFALSDCGCDLAFTCEVEIEFYALQTDGSHFSIETRGLLLANTLCLLVTLANTYQTWRQARSQFQNAGLHPVLWIFLLSLAGQCLGRSLHTFHLCYCWYDGMTRKSLEFASGVSLALSEALSSSLILTISLGYTLLQSNLGSLEIMIPVSFTLVVAFVNLVCINKLIDITFRLHEFDSVIGWILFGLKLSLYLLFLWKIQSISKSRGERLSVFCREFRSAGSMNLLAYPVAFLLATLSHPLWCRYVMETTMMFLQFSSFVWLGSMFLHRGSYHAVSTLGDSMLPGGTKMGYIKKE